MALKSNGLQLTMGISKGCCSWIGDISVLTWDNNRYIYYNNNDNNNNNNNSNYNNNDDDDDDDNKYMLFAGWEDRIVKNCDRGLENAEFSRQRSQFFTISTDPKRTNNMFIFFFLR